MPGCPVLEELIIEKIMDQDLVCCNISSPTLKSALTLIEADIHLKNDRVKEDEVLYSRSVLEFVDRLCNVKSLKFSSGYTKVDRDLKCWVEPQQVPPCLSPHLRTVIIVYGCAVHEYEIVRYALRNGSLEEEDGNISEI